MCAQHEENIEHFMNCRANGKVSCETNWTEIYGNNVENQVKVAKEIKERTVHKK